MLDTPKEETAEPTTWKETWWPKIKKFITRLGVIVGIIAGIAEFSGFNLQSLFSNQPEKITAGSLTVFVHGKKGPNDLILKKRGSVEITYGTKRAKENINEKGQVTFNEIPLHYFDGQSTVMLQIRDTEGEPYHATSSDSLYIPEKGTPVYLEVELEGLDKIFGTVIYNDQPLSGVSVSINELVDTTNHLGSFSLQIPSDQHKQQQEVKFYKPNFKLKVINAYPQTQAPLNIVMDKK